MPRRKAEGFVLRTRPIGEADLLVTLLTAEEGKLQAIARSAKKSQKRFGSALEPLTLVRASWTETQGRELARLESCDLLISYVEAQRDLPRFYLFAYLAEVSDLFCRERDPDPRFFRLLGAVLDAAAGGLDGRAARRYFDLWVLRLQGLLPELSSCARCGGEVGREGGIVDLSEGVLLCVRCGASAPAAERVRLSGAALEAARQALRLPPARAGALAGENARGRGGNTTGRGGMEGLDRLARAAMQRFTERPIRSLEHLVLLESSPAEGIET